MEGTSSINFFRSVSFKPLSKILFAIWSTISFGVSLNYITNDTLSYLLGKAGSHEKALAGLIKEESKEEKPVEEKKDEKPAEEEKGKVEEENKGESQNK